MVQATGDCSTRCRQFERTLVLCLPVNHTLHSKMACTKHLDSRYVWRTSKMACTKHLDSRYVWRTSKMACTKHLDSRYVWRTTVVNLRGRVPMIPTKTRLESASENLFFNYVFGFFSGNSNEHRVRKCNPMSHCYFQYCAIPHVCVKTIGLVLLWVIGDFNTSTPVTSSLTSILVLLWPSSLTSILVVPGVQHPLGQDVYATFAPQDPCVFPPFPLLEAGSVASFFFSYNNRGTH